MVYGVGGSMPLFKGPSYIVNQFSSLGILCTSKEPFDHKLMATLAATSLCGFCRADDQLESDAAAP